MQRRSEIVLSKDDLYAILRAHLTPLYPGENLVGVTIKDETVTASMGANSLDPISGKYQRPPSRTSD